MQKEKWSISFQSIKMPLVFILFFYSIAIILHINSDGYFYLFNFMYIGTSIATGLFLLKTLPRTKKHYSRRISQVLVGGYMLIYLGVIMQENMQIEGFFIYLIEGMFAGALIHYLIAKIGGTLLFGRGWCGWACWTAMILDFLPYKQPVNPRKKKYEVIRYIHFILTTLVVLSVYFFYYFNNIGFSSNWELKWLLIGNSIYYFLGIGLAYILKDNRAFCKYLCPITVLMKIGTRLSAIRMKIDNNKCIECMKCEKVCPMDVKLISYKKLNKRISSTECILCNECSMVCPKEAVSISIGIGASLNRK